MFEKTRLKLTAWYLLIIMLISVSFSVAIYKSLTSELDRVERMQRQKQQEQFPYPIRQLFPRAIDQEIIDETENRLVERLFLTNLGILIFAGAAGYFLAGRTLRPIKEMLDEQNRFITDASHELRTPLTSLKSEIEVNLRDKKLNSDTKKILESNLEEVNNLQYLSDNLIKLAQYQKSNGNIAFEKVSLSEVVGDAVKKVSAMAKVKQIKIVNDIKDFSVEGDKQSLTELFVILLDNAIKYSSKNKTVNVSNKKIDHSVAIEIKDEGVGIAEENIPHLFDRFYRGDKSRTKEGATGYGLGLSIAKQIVGKHHGTIRVESEIDSGTIFTIKLPLAR